VASTLDTLFAALADPTRRAILTRLADGEATVLELAEPFDLSQPAISKHLKVLEAAGLIQRSQEGTRRPARLAPEALEAGLGWLLALRRPGRPAAARRAATLKAAGPARVPHPWRRL